MLKIPSLLLPAIVAALTLGCGGAEPVEEVNPLRAAGEGQVFRADPGLDALVPEGAMIEKLAGGFMFIEGPIWVSRAWEGAPFLLFSDVLGNAIYKWSPSGGAPVDFKKPVFEGEVAEGRLAGSNGLTLDAAGNLFVAEHGNRRIAKVTPDGKWTSFVDKFEGKRLNSPNDLVWRGADWLYFTDPPYGLVGQDESPDKELEHNGVYRISADGKTLELLEPRMTRPNGIAFSPDGATMYVANSDPAQKMWQSFTVREDGSLGLGRSFYDVTDQMEEGLPDGLKVDNQGNIFATGPGGVWIFSADGKHLGTIKPTEVPANVAWGDDGSTLYMTARTGLYRIKLSTGGKIL